MVTMMTTTEQKTIHELVQTVHDVDLLLTTVEFVWGIWAVKHAIASCTRTYTLNAVSTSKVRRRTVRWHHQQSSSAWDRISETLTVILIWYKCTVAAAAILNYLLPVPIFIIWLSLGSGDGCSCRPKISSQCSIIYGLHIKLCQKMQNGGCRNHEVLFGNLGPTRLPNFKPRSLLKLHFNRATTFRHMAIWKFFKFGLKHLFPPPKIAFLGVCPLYIIFRHREFPKRHFLAWNRVIWAIVR